MLRFAQAPELGIDAQNFPLAFSEYRSLIDLALRDCYAAA
jgi:hypothetical protein